MMCGKASVCHVIYYWLFASSAIPGSAIWGRICLRILKNFSSEYKPKSCLKKKRNWVKWYLKTIRFCMSPWHFGLSTGKFMAIGIFKSPGSRDPCSHSKRMCVSHHLQNILCNPLEERRGSVVKSPLIVLCPSDLYFVKWDPLINFFTLHTGQFLLQL